MLTIRAEVLKDKKRTDGTYNVKVRFIKDKKVKRISTDLFATDTDLTADLKLKEGSITKQEADRLVLHYRTLFNTWKSRARLTPEGKATVTPENLLFLTPLKS
jgi:hypothetical protein